LLAEVRPEKGSGSEPIAKAATAIRMYNDGGQWWATAGDGERATAAVMQWQAVPELEGGSRLTQRGWYGSS